MNKNKTGSLKKQKREEARGSNKGTRGREGIIAILGLVRGKVCMKGRREGKKY